MRDVARQPPLFWWAVGLIALVGSFAAQWEEGLAAPRRRRRRVVVESSSSDSDSEGDDGKGSSSDDEKSNDGAKED